MANAHLLICTVCQDWILVFNKYMTSNDIVRLKFILPYTGRNNFTRSKQCKKKTATEETYIPLFLFFMWVKYKLYI